MQLQFLTKIYTGFLVSKQKYTSVLIENVEVEVTGRYKILRGSTKFYVVGRGGYHTCNTLGEANKKLRQLCNNRKSRNKNKHKKKKPKNSNVIPKQPEVWYRRPTKIDKDE